MWEHSTTPMEINMRYLVTGGAGFIGSHLVDALLTRAGTTAVTVVDDLSTGSLDNLSNAQRDPRLRIVTADVRDSLVGTHLAPADVVYHLASPASPPAYMADPIGTLRTNAWGTDNVLQLAHLWNARLVLTSTSEVYGDPQVHPQPEQYWGNVNPIGPRSCYDEGKRFAEALVAAAVQQYAINCGIVRIFNTYGPRMAPTDGRVMSNFISQALAGNPLTIYGSGHQTRSFCFVSDTVAALVAMGHSDVAGPLNIGNPGEFTMLELAELVREAIDPTLGWEFLPLPTDDPQRRRPDISAAQAQLGWQPETSLADGLAAMIAAYRATAAQRPPLAAAVA